MLKKLSVIVVLSIMSIYFSYLVFITTDGDKNFVFTSILMVIGAYAVVVSALFSSDTEVNTERTERIMKGDYVQHFKRDANDKTTLMFLYKVLETDVLHTETKERLVVYQALYDDNEVFARPYDMFMSEVDKEKYPDATQTYRLEVVTDEEILDLIEDFNDKELD